MKNFQAGEFFGHALHCNHCKKVEVSIIGLTATDRCCAVGLRILGLDVAPLRIVTNRPPSAGMEG